MLVTPGCWAWEEMGALFAGVFWGVLEDGSVFVICGGSVVNFCSTYGAVVRSSFLLRIGSDMIWLNMRCWND